MDSIIGDRTLFDGLPGCLTGVGEAVLAAYRSTTKGLERGIRYVVLCRSLFRQVKLSWPKPSL